MDYKPKLPTLAFVLVRVVCLKVTCEFLLSLFYHWPPSTSIKGTQYSRILHALGLLHWGSLRYLPSKCKALGLWKLHTVWLPSFYLYGSSNLKCNPTVWMILHGLHLYVRTNNLINAHFTTPSFSAILMWTILISYMLRTPLDHIYDVALDDNTMT